MWKTLALPLRGKAHNSNLTRSLFIKVPVPSQESERSCLCVLGVTLYKARKVSDHVFVC